MAVTRGRRSTSGMASSSGLVPWSWMTVARPRASALRLTATTRRAPSARVTETGTGLESAPSISQRPPIRTGGRMPGRA